MIVYVDTDYVCHIDDADGRRAFDVPFFDGRSPYFIEHYRYIPAGETWTRADGSSFSGEMIAPAYRYGWEALALPEELDAAYQTIGELVEMIYGNDMEVIG